MSLKARKTLPRKGRSCSLNHLLVLRNRLRNGFRFFWWDASFIGSWSFVMIGVLDSESPVAVKKEFLAWSLGSSGIYLVIAGKDLWPQVPRVRLTFSTSQDTLRPEFPVDWISPEGKKLWQLPIPVAFSLMPLKLAGSIGQPKEPWIVPIVVANFDQTPELPLIFYTVIIKKTSISKLF